MFGCQPSLMFGWRKPVDKRIILIRIENVNQIFNSFDPSPFHERDLDSDAEEFILTLAEEIWNEGSHFRDYEIEIILDELPSDDDYKKIFHHNSSMSSLNNSLAKLAEETSPQKAMVSFTAEEAAAQRAPAVLEPTENSKRVKRSFKRKWSISTYDKKGSLTPSNLIFFAPDNKVNPASFPTKESSLMARLALDLRYAIRNHFRFQYKKHQNTIKRFLTSLQLSLFFGLVILIIYVTIERLLAAAKESASDNGDKVQFNDPKGWVS